MFWKSTLIAAVLTAASLPAAAHDTYIQKRFGDWTVVNAHGAAVDDAYKAAKIRDVAAHDGNGGQISASFEDKENYVALTAGEGAAVLGATYYSGFWVKDTDGDWHNTTLDQVENAASSGEYIRNAVALVGHASAYEPFGFALEIVPASDPLDLKPGDSFEVTVLADGAPLAGAEITSILPGVPAVVADAQGRAKIVVNEGHNILLVKHSPQHPEPAKAEKLGLKATLSFIPNDDHSH